MGTKLFLIFFAALIVNNILLIRFIALCSFFGVSTKIETAIGMSMAVIFVMIMATTVSWTLWYYALVPLKLEFLRTGTFILVIATLVQFEEMFIRRVSPTLFRALGIYLPLVTTNCAILAVTFIAVDRSYNLLESLVYTVGVALGYSLAIVLLATIRERIFLYPIPGVFRGYPIAFIIACLMSLSFLGFDGLFGLKFG